MRFTTCRRGHTHWGHLGAAGVLAVDAGQVLLQLRSARVHHGGSWSIPGGAVERGESAEQAALREAEEESGLVREALQVVDEYVADCGGWSYTTVLARLSAPVRLRPNFETAQMIWQPVEQVTRLDLHPAFASAWDQRLRAAVHGLG